MKIGLISVDDHNFPSLPLMKLSAWLKSLESRQEHVKSERKERNKKERPKSKPAKKEVTDEKP